MWPLFRFLWPWFMVVSGKVRMNYFSMWMTMLHSMRRQVICVWDLLINDAIYSNDLAMGRPQFSNSLWHIHIPTYTCFQRVLDICYNLYTKRDNICPCSKGSLLSCNWFTAGMLTLYMLINISIYFHFLSFTLHSSIFYWHICIWVGSRNCGCLVTWFCKQLIAKPGNKTAAVLWPDPYIYNIYIWVFINLRIT